MKKKIISLIIVIIATTHIANAQTTEVKISLNEQFFDALLEAVFTHLDEPSVPISGMSRESRVQSPEKDESKSTKSENSMKTVSFKTDSRLSTLDSSPVCDESIKLKREIDGVKTAVRFRDGQIIAPIAFKGNYNPPLIGCIEFSGWAETNIELSFDRSKNALVGNAKVQKVNLSGTGGIGSSILARFVQSSIDNKINPIEIIKLDKLSFTTPIQNSGSLKMKALGIRHRVNNKSLDVYLKYRFEKG